MEHRYLVTLEIGPLKVGNVYDELPSHLTLMSRFLTSLEPTTLTDKIEPLFTKFKPIRFTFAETSELGPKKLTVQLIEYSVELSHLHHELQTLLDSIHVNYEYPQFIGENHKPHITWREGQRFGQGDSHLARNCYLIEIIKKQRVVQSKLNLSA